MTIRDNVVFDRLSSVDFGDQVFKVRGLSYVSWANVWSKLASIYPESTYEVKTFGEEERPYSYDPQLGLMVMTEVTVENITRPMWLSVMDTNQEAIAIEDATMNDINTSIMRCLVKNIAMFGLGLYLYQGLSESSDTASQTSVPEVVDNISSLERILTTEIWFGKYNGLTMKTIYREDPSYIDWLSREARDLETRENALKVKEHYSIDTDEVQQEPSLDIDEKEEAEQTEEDFGTGVFYDRIKALADSLNKSISEIHEEIFDTISDKVEYSVTELKPDIVPLYEQLLSSKETMAKLRHNIIEQQEEAQPRKTMLVPEYNPNNDYNLRF